MQSRLLIVSITALSGALLLLAAPALAEAPGVRAAPTVTGAAAVGQQLTAHNGTWLYLDGASCQSECVMTYQWQRCSSSCGEIGGASGRFYTVQPADAGYRLRVEETMTKEDCGEWNYSTGTRECRAVSKTASSALTAVVPGSAAGSPAPSAPAAPASPLAPSASSAPAVTGVAMLDHTLTATQGAWSGSPFAIALRWERCDANGGSCVDLGLNGTSYTVLAVDVGKRLRVVGTAVNGAGARSVASAPSDVVVELRPHAGLTSITADRVTAPHKLVLAKSGASPTRVRRGRQVSVRVQVLDSRGFTIQGAVVMVASVSTAATTGPATATTDANGNATLVLTTSPRLNLAKTKKITLVVTARRPSDRINSPRTARAQLVVTPRR